MKKLFLTVGILCGLYGLSHAGISEGYAGSFANEKMWFSSYTSSNDAPVRPIATGTVIIGYVQVLSTGSVSSIQFVKSTATAVANRFLHYSSAATPFPIDTYNPSATMIYVMQVSSTGWAYTTTSQDGIPAKIRILWDYFITR